MHKSLGAILALTALSMASATYLPATHVLNASLLAVADEDEIDDDIDEEIDEEIEDQIDDEIEDELADEIESELEDEFDEAIEDEIADEIDEDLDHEMDDAFDDEIEEDLDREIDEAFDLSDEALEEEIHDAWMELEIEGELEAPEDEDDDALEDDLDEDWDEDEEEDFDEDDHDEEHDEDEDEEGEEDELEEAIYDDVEFETDEDGDLFTANEYLVLASPDDIDALIASGLTAENVSDLASLDLKLARVSTLGSQSLEDLETLVAEVAPEAQIDVNNLYLEQASPETAPAPVNDAPEPLSWQNGLRLGLIDTQLDRGHIAFAKSRIVERDFVPFNRPRPTQHGTAVASILIGQSPTQMGLLPNAELYAASVFFEPASGGASATTESLVAALDWLVAANVDVINMSLSGPPNNILQQAVRRVDEKGIYLVAAVGNEGPVAEPRYPAGYSGVVGVTAVSKSKKVFRLAGRGAHVDFSAPGVNVYHATPGSKFGVSAGTSFAAPFVAAILAYESQTQSQPDLLQRLFAQAEDLGPSGFDPIYGHGLIKRLSGQPQLTGSNPIPPASERD